MHYLAFTQRMLRYSVLMRLNKPIGILLLLWPTLWALWLAAKGVTDWHHLWIFCAAVVVLRSAGCIINDIADRDFDQHVARTQQRPLACHVVSLKEAVILFIALLGIGLWLLLQLNTLAIICGVIASVLILLYPLAKRYTHFPQVVLGIVFYTSVPIAFAATLGHFTRLMWWLYLSTIIWAVIYDTYYAMADRQEDLKIGIKSTAILFGQYDRFILACLQVVFIGLLAYVGQLADLNHNYYIALIIAALLCLYHQYLIRKRDPACCLQAFLHSHWIGFVMLVGIALSLGFYPY